MKKNDISPSFTIADIHKIRENIDEIIKDMTDEEIVEYYNQMGKKAKDNIEKE